MRAKISHDAPILTVSVAAELAGMHPQTVRQYDRLGLVVASRTQGGGRRYSLQDVDKLIEIQRLSQEEGINLSGILRIMRLEHEAEQLQRQLDTQAKQLEKMRLLVEFLRSELANQTAKENRIFVASASGDITPMDRLTNLRRSLQKVDQRQGREIVLWRPQNVVVIEAEN